MKKYAKEASLVIKRLLVPKVHIWKKEEKILLVNWRTRKSDDNKFWICEKFITTQKNVPNVSEEG